MQAYGVGIELQPDYGVISCFRHTGQGMSDAGDFFDAKIEGDEQYKRLWRLSAIRADSVNADDSRLPEETPTYIPDPQDSGKDAMYHWLKIEEKYGRPVTWDPRPYIDRTTDPIMIMLEQLKKAAIEKMGSSFNMSECATPFPVSAAFKIHICAARWGGYIGGDMISGEYAARKHLKSFGKCNLNQWSSDHTTQITKDHPEYRNDPMQALFAVEYTRAALTGLLMTEKHGRISTRRIFHDSRLGSDGISQGSEEEKRRKCDELATVVRKLIKPPFKTERGEEETDTIAQVITVGEECDNPILRTVLAEIFPDREFDGFDKNSKHEAVYIAARDVGRMGYLWRLWDGRC